MATRDELRERVERAVTDFESFLHPNLVERLALRCSRLFLDPKKVSYSQRRGVYIAYGHGELLDVGVSTREIAGRLASKTRMWREAGLTRCQTVTIHAGYSFFLLALEDFLIKKLKPRLNNRGR